MAQDFPTWLNQLRETRRRWVAANHENHFDRGIFNATVDKYPDPTHFIYELLQNAEDTGAKTARFRLEPQAIVFEHDGRPFDRADIEGITGIGNTTKLEDANKIGSFGIGFKSAYVVSKRPEVHSRIEGVDIAFAIEDLVVPELIPTIYDDDRTRIVLPLPPADAAETIARVKSALDVSGARSLLFLRNISRLEWTQGPTEAHGAVQDGDEGTRTLLSVSGATPARSESFVLLTRDVKRDEDARNYAVKIALKLDESGKIIPEAVPTRLAVFFETEEATGLYFQVHGPFQLTDNRANIKRGDPWNNRLIGGIAKLLADSLPGLRDRGLMTRGLIETLPNASDGLTETWHPVLDAVVATFSANDLLPAHGSGHVSVPAAVRGPSDIRDVLADEGMAMLQGNEGCRWIARGMQNGRMDLFLQTLKIREWSYSEFFQAFVSAFANSWSPRETEARNRAKSWFDGLPDDRLQRLYLLLESAVKVTKRTGALTHVPFVRLEDGTRSTPAKALLAPVDVQLDEEAAAHGLSLVRSALVRGGRARGKEVEQFLRRAGVKEIGEGDYLAAIVRANYRPGTRGPNAERHLQHMRRFIKWFGESRDTRMFEGALLTRVEGSEGYHSPSTVYMDRPFVESDLSRIYDGSVAGRDRKPIWSGYAKLKRTEFVAFTAMLGVEQALTVEPKRISYAHPRYSVLVYGFGSTRVTSTSINSDFTIQDIEGLLARRDAGIAAMIWRAVSASGARSMHARYAPNKEHTPHQELSSLALALKQAAWIPMKDGSFRRPAGATEQELADGLSTKGNEPWLTLIDFAAEHRRRSQQHMARRTAAQSIGLPGELADRLEQLSPEELATFGSEMLRRAENASFSRHEFPERDAPNPQRRSERVAERAKAAPIKAYETRSRTVRTSDRDSKVLARPYLRDLYTNPAGEMICQACHDAMPFRLDDGNPYFEAPEFLESASQELAENHLALCPTCCAKWMHASGTSDSELRAALLTAENDEIAVLLAGAEVRLRFVGIHFEDLRAIIPAIESMKA